MNDTDLLMISALQHYAYCPRQFALIHVEQVWEENRFTAEGRILHERVDSGVAEQRQNIRYERGVLLNSEKFGIRGKMDLLEVHEVEFENETRIKYFPVEYKRGKPKVDAWDRIQLCAQVFCIEEMRDTSIAEGAIWYWEVRKREFVVIDEALRAMTEATINGAHELLVTGKTPPPVEDKKRCRACSLINLCEPDRFRRDKSVSYVRELFSS